MLLGITFGEDHLWMVTSKMLKQCFAKATQFAALID